MCGVVFMGGCRRTYTRLRGLAQIFSGKLNISCMRQESQNAVQSGRGQPHSRTLPAIVSVTNSARSWSAAVLCRFGFTAYGGAKKETSNLNSSEKTLF